MTDLQITLRDFFPHRHLWAAGSANRDNANAIIRRLIVLIRSAR